MRKKRKFYHESESRIMTECLATFFFKKRRKEDNECNDVFVRLANACILKVNLVVGGKIKGDI